MITLTGVLFGAGLLISLGICLLGVASYRRYNEPGIVSFTAFTLLFGAGGVAGGVVSLWLGPVTGGLPWWTQIALPALFLWTVPWALFGLQYTGRYTQIRWRLVLLAYVPSVGVLAFELGLRELVGVESRLLTQLAGGIAFLYILSLFGLGVYLLLQTTHRYGHLSAWQGLSLVLVVVVHFVILNSANTALGGSEIRAMAGLYVMAYGVSAGALSVALFRYELFDSTPAIGEISERAIASETDDLLIVVDEDGHIIRLNDSAVAAVGPTRETVLGTDLTSTVGNGIEGFQRQETVTLEATGSRKYDSQVSTVTDQHDRRLGYLLTLHDVTDRELREQRLSVLNRVLRHNLRNKIEVVKAHTEMLDGDQEHIDSILAASEDIVGLGRSARSIDKVVSEATATSEVDIQQTVESVLEESPPVALTCDVPDSLSVVTNPTALSSALESAIENAVSYAESTVEITAEKRPAGCRIRIADDGPGIPQSELDSIQGGTETALQHSTGLGLWQLKWAVRTMGGELSVDTHDGTTVDIVIPDQTA